MFDTEIDEDLYAKCPLSDHCIRYLTSEVTAGDTGTCAIVHSGDYEIVKADSVIRLMLPELPEDVRELVAAMRLDGRGVLEHEGAEWTLAAKLEGEELANGRFSDTLHKGILTLCNAVMREVANDPEATHIFSVVKHPAKDSGRPTPESFVALLHCTV